MWKEVVGLVTRSVRTSISRGVRHLLARWPTHRAVEEVEGLVTRSVRTSLSREVRYLLARWPTHRAVAEQ